MHDIFLLLKVCILALSVVGCSILLVVVCWVVFGKDYLFEDLEFEKSELVEKLELDRLREEDGIPR